MFDIGLWNVMEQTLAEEGRTNNHAEACHRGFQSHVGCHHPTIWKFLDVWKKEKIAEIKRIPNLAGQEPPPKRKKYMPTEGRLRSHRGLPQPR